MEKIWLPKYSRINWQLHRSILKAAARSEHLQVLTEQVRRAD